MKIIIIIISLLLFQLNTLFAQNVAQQKLRLAETYEKSGDMENASRIFEELFVENPLNNQYFEGIVRTMKAMNRFSDLLPHLKNRYERSKDLQTFAIYGEILWRTGNTSEANKIWEQGIRQHKDKQEIYVLISNSQVQLQQFERAINLLIEGRKNLNNQLLFSDALSRLYIAIGDYRRGTSEALTLLKSGGNLALVQGRIYALISDEESSNYIQNELWNNAASNSDNIIYQELYAWFLRTMNRLDQALEVYINIDRLRNSKGADIIRFGEDSRRDGQFDIAMKAFAHIIDQGKSNLYNNTALYGYARTLEQKILLNKEISRKDAQEIISRYRSIINDFPGTQQTAESRIRIAAISSEFLDDIKTAINELELAMKERPNSQIAANAGLDLGNIYIKNQQFDLAETLFADVSKKYKNNFQSVANRAKLLIADIVYFKGLIDSSLSLYSELIVVPETDIANEALNRIVIIEQNRQYAQGLVVFSKAEFAERRRKFNDAIKHYEEVVEIASFTPLAELSLRRKADLEHSSGNYNSSISTLKQLLDEYPNSIHSDYSLFLIGDNYLALGNREEAMKYYTELLVKHPRSIYLNQTRQKIRQIRES